VCVGIGVRVVFVMAVGEGMIWDCYGALDVSAYRMLFSQLVEMRRK